MHKLPTEILIFDTSVPIRSTVRSSQ